MVRSVLPMVLAAAMIPLLCPLACAQADPNAPHLTCEVGPVEKTFGSTLWLAYSCDDNRSLILVSAPGNPAMPFVYSLIAKGKTYQVSGEGTGNKAASAAAWAEISRLSEQAIRSLVAETRRKGR